MKFKFIRDYRNITTLIDGPYNAPKDCVEHLENHFEQEYEIFRKDLDSILECYCDSTQVPREWIDLGHRTGFTRGIGLVVEEGAAIHLLPLVGLIQSYLGTLSQDYCVSINIVLHEFGDFRDLYLGITKSEEIFVHADKAKWFRAIGINC